MVDTQELVLETIPIVVGLMLAGYFALQVYRLRRDFFAVVRSWIFILLVILLVGFWVIKLLDYTIAGAEAHFETDMTFIVAAVWLSVCWMSLTAVYKYQDSVTRFVDWLQKNPLNLITLWGLAALAIIGFMWASLLVGESRTYRDLWIYLVLLYLLAAVAFDIVMAFRIRAKGFAAALPGEGYKGVLVLLAVWIGLPVVELVFDVIVEIQMGLEQYSLENWMVLALFGIMVGWVQKRGFLAIMVEPEEETVKLAGYRNFDIPRGIYLIEDEKPDSAFRLFADLVTLPLRPDAKIPGADESPSATLEFLIPRGLMITREYPENLRKEYNLQVTPIIWLTESPGDRRVAPTSLAVLTDTLMRFMEATPNGIVLLEGIEYLTTFNDFKKILRQLDSLNETAWITKTRLLITADPKAFDEKDLALLERDREVLKGPAEIEEIKRESSVMTAAG